MADHRLFINQSARDPARRLVVAFDSTAPAEVPVFSRGSQPSFELHFLRENPDTSDRSRPFVYDNPAAWDAVKMSLGPIDAAPTSGTFTLTDPAAAQTTGAIDFDATAGEVQTAIRAALTTNYGSAVVSGSASSWEIQRVTTGAIATLTASAAALAPAGSIVLIENTQEGTASLDERFQVTLLKARPAERSSGWSALPAAAVSVSVQTAGSGTVNKAFRVTWNADAYAGGITLSFTGDTVTETVGPWDYNATAAQIVAAFEAHTDVEAAGVTVLKNGPGDYTITCVGTGIKLSNTPALATSSHTLSVPTGLSGTLNCATVGISTLLGTATETTTVFEIEKTVAGIPDLVFQVTDAVLRKDLIRNATAVSEESPGPLFAKSAISTNAEGLDFCDVTYSTAFPEGWRGIPVACVLKSDPADDNVAVVGISNNDRFGFRVHFSAPLPAEGYLMSWIAHPHADA